MTQNGIATRSTQAVSKTGNIAADLMSLDARTPRHREAAKLEIAHEVAGFLKSSDLTITISERWSDGLHMRIFQHVDVKGPRSALQDAHAKLVSDVINRAKSRHSAKFGRLSAI